MKNTLHNDTQYLHKNMFDHITDVSLSNNISDLIDIQDISTATHEHHKDENYYLKYGMSRFTRALIISLPIEIHTQEWEKIPINCKILSRTMKDLINENIIKNIHLANSLDFLDIDFEFEFKDKKFSEYDSNNEKSYLAIKEHIIKFIKENPAIKKVIIDNYCEELFFMLEYVKSKEPLINQWEQTTRDLFEAFGMPKTFVLSENRKFTTDALVLSSYGSDWEKVLSPKQTKTFEKLQEIGKKLNGFDSGYETKRYVENFKKNNKEIDKIFVQIRDGEKEILLDSKFFFLDNGDNLYDDIIENSKYNQYYQAELDLIKENQEKIQPYIKSHYIGLWCGNGKKDQTMISENMHGKFVTYGDPRNQSYPENEVTRVLLMDSSLKSLSKAEKAMSENRSHQWMIYSGSTRVLFSQERIDKLLQNNDIKAFTSVINNPHEMIINIPDIRETLNIFTLFGWTFGNFGNHQQTFLQQINTLMNVWDILCMSLFNLPISNEEKQQIVDIYNTPQTHLFIRNFFVKLGIPEDAIKVQVSYDNNTNSVNIDAKIHTKNNQPIIINPTGVETKIPDDTIFHCFSSQRMDEHDLQKRIDQSNLPLKVINKITLPGNPFSLYMISK